MKLRLEKAKKIEEKKLETQNQNERKISNRESKRGSCTKFRLPILVMTKL